MRTVTVGNNEENKRLDWVLKKLLPQASQGVIYKSLRKKRVKVNGRRVTDGGLRLHAGDILELYLDDALFAREEALPLWRTLTPRLTILYEDKHILVMDKPAGLLSQSETEVSLEAHMRAYLYRGGAFDPTQERTFLPSLCHRIDRNTEGLVLGAKDAESLRVLNQKMRNREIKKFYLCETEGTPSPAQGELTGWLKKEKKRMYPADETTPGALYYHTRYRVLRPGSHALVEAELLTGRTHQIRAGFALMGCPLVGDIKYGAAPVEGGFQRLTAYRLVFDFTTDAGCLNALKGREFLRR